MANHLTNRLSVFKSLWFTIFNFSNRRECLPFIVPKLVLGFPEILSQMIFIIPLTIIMIRNESARIRAQNYKIKNISALCATSSSLLNCNKLSFHFSLIMNCINYKTWLTWQNCLISSIYLDTRCNHYDSYLRQSCN